MTLKEIKELIELVREKDIAELEVERANEKIRIRRWASVEGSPPIAFATMAPALPAPAPAVEPAAAPREAEQLHIVKSPIVGTFYDSPSPGASVFVQVGDAVEAGQVLCIIEAMKLMNEIEADVSGVVEKRFVSNQQPVEYGEALFGIRKS